MLPGRPYLLKIGAKTVGATIAAPKYKVNVNTLEHLAAKTLELNEIGVCNLSLDQPIAFDPYAENRDTGGFILIDRLTNATVGAGMLHFALRRSQNIHWQAIEVNKQAHAALKGQQAVRACGSPGCPAPASRRSPTSSRRSCTRWAATPICWTATTCATASTRTWASPTADRVENIRRVAEVAKLMVDAGLIVLVSFISPFRAERRWRASCVEPGEFCEVFVDTPLEVAEQRDPKGLYKKARRGELKNFTGIDSPYEPPEHAEVRIDTVASAPEDAAEAIIAQLRRMGVLGLYMKRFYAFNGDADGLCALQQLRLVDPRDATLVTGVKRDIQLLRRVNAATGDEVTVLDISLDANRERSLPSAGRGRYRSLFRPPLCGRAATTPESRGTHRGIVRRLHEHSGRPPSRRPSSPVGHRGSLRRQPGGPCRCDGRGRRHRHGDGRHARAARHLPQLQRLWEYRKRSLFRSRGSGAADVAVRGSHGVRPPLAGFRAARRVLRRGHAKGARAHACAGGAGSDDASCCRTRRGRGGRSACLRTS